MQRLLLMRWASRRAKFCLSSMTWRPMTSDLALRLARCFRTSPQFWLGLQTAHDLAMAQARSGAEIEASVQPLAA